MLLLAVAVSLVVGVGEIKRARLEASAILVIEINI